MYVMLDQSLRRLLALYPRGVSNRQLEWRLKDGGLRVGAEDILQALVALAERGEVRHDRLGRWHLVAMAGSGKAGSAVPLAKSSDPAPPSVLHAVPLTHVSTQVQARPDGVDDGRSSLRTLPDHARLLFYYAATQRRDPRGRITLFSDTHAQSWQLVTARGGWWETGRLVSTADALPESFRESLSKRSGSGAAALGWPLMVAKTPEGPSILPALVLPVEWRLSAAGLEIEVVKGKPSINPDWLFEVRRSTTWSEASLVERLFPEGEVDDLPAVADRLRHALATLGAGGLKPAQLAGQLSLAPFGLQNTAVLALPSDATFTRGAADDLESMAGWSTEMIAGTALAALWDDAPRGSGPIAALVSPRPLTDRQIEAADAALTAPLTVIQGPPGTGKSQVILALILSCLLTGQSVLFSSKNHQALDEVEKRLRELVPEAPLLTRGRDADGERDVSFLQALKELSQDALLPIGPEPLAIARIRKKAQDAAGQRANARDQERQHRALCALCDDLERLREASDSPQAFAQSQLRPGLLERVLNMLVVLLGLGKRTPKGAAAFNLATPRMLLRQIADLKAKLRETAAQENDDTNPEDLSTVLDALARHRTSPTTEDHARIVAEVEELGFANVKRARKLGVDAARLLLRYRPVWAVSALSVPSRVPLHPSLFDVVIFDEASQCDIASALPLMARAKRAVVVGDPQQLRFIPSLGNSTEHALMDASNLPLTGRSAFAQSTNSLFDFVSRRPGAQRFFLKDQYRSAPAIVDYLNAEFYIGKGLEGRRASDDYRPPLDYKAGLTWLDVKGRTTREDGGNVNLAEVEKIVETLRRIAGDPGFAGSVGVLSPFNAQVARMQRACEAELTKDIRHRLQLRISTIDKFQGGEADVILFSLVASPGTVQTALGFLQKEHRRLNVAISRARALCLVVGDLDFAATCGVRHIERLARRATTPFSPPRPPFDSLWERRLDAAMRTRGLLPFPQYPVGTRYLDFALDPERRRLDVEVDGRVWHVDADGNRKVADRLRDMELTGRGWTVLRFWVHELSQDMEGCLDRIEHALGKR